MTAWILECADFVSALVFLPHHKSIDSSHHSDTPQKGLSQYYLAPSILKYTQRKQPLFSRKSTEVVFPESTKTRHTREESATQVDRRQ